MTASFFRPGLVHFTLFCGVGTFMLAVISATAFYRNPRIQVFTMLLVGSTLVAVSPHLTALLYRLSPVFRASRVERISVVGCFSMSALAGLSFDKLAEIRVDSRLRKRALGAIVLVICFALGVALFWQIQGEDLLIKIAQNAGQTTSKLWGKIHAYTRSSEVKRWIDGDIDAWLSYEMKQVARSLALVFASGFLLWLLVGPKLSLRTRKILGIALVFLVCLDIWFTARNYLVLQVSDCFFETPGIKMINGLLGGDGCWRIRTVYSPGEDIEVLPPNTNQIFGIQSLNGLCTIIPKGYSDFQNAYAEFTLPTWLRNRQAPHRPEDILLSNLGCVRYVVCSKQDKVFLPNPILNLFGSSEQTDQFIRILNLGGIGKVAIRQPPGKVLNVRIQTPQIKFLDIEFGFNSNKSDQGDTVTCLVNCKGKNSEVTVKKGFDLYLDKGRWHPIRVDISEISGETLSLRFSFSESAESKNTTVNAGWAGFDLVYGDCKVTRMQNGSYLIEGNLGESLSISVGSNCRECPLEIVTDSGFRRMVYVAFTKEMPMREITLYLDQPGIKKAVITSDSSFVINRARSIYISKNYEGFSLIYDNDMFVYENHNAVRRGICLDREKIDVEDEKIVISEIENIADLECGRCSILEYKPERVALDVSCDRSCFLVFQDVWFPGWRAKVNGIEKSILQTDTGMRAIDLDAGHHKIEMTYKPRSLRVGLGFTLVGIVLGLVLYSGFDPVPSISKRWKKAFVVSKLDS